MNVIIYVQIFCLVSLQVAKKISPLIKFKWKPRWCVTFHQMPISGSSMYECCIKEVSFCLIYEVTLLSAVLPFSFYNYSRSRPAASATSGSTCRESESAVSPQKYRMHLSVLVPAQHLSLKSPPSESSSADSHSGAVYTAEITHSNSIQLWLEITIIITTA